MSSWITVTPRLQQGLNVVSQVDNGKFRLLVNHICQGLHSTVNDKIFTVEEEDKLMLSLNMNKETLSLLLDTMTFIYSQAAFGVVKPAMMENVLKESFSIAEEKVSIIVNAWIIHAKRIIDALRQKSIFPRHVEDVNWSLNIQTASKATVLEPKSKVLLQLGMTGTKRDTITVEMDKTGVAELYDNLEKIQSQLDAMK
ncbi:hypothetical protein PV325_013262 [Microctonus aethiopoides]|uniref:COMM domain-containing protein n=1 Tax=Microctonus aethiopoides TaxID=144406 RepID=A0AA39KQM8_9HYME|nr:hypothetical protein PV325_013262 [Microctonus aethiopoides]KAK0097322.1 hypothetical protein PV326_002512 [Microctonus aethiopoides]KAK0169976.1 hypothetical protein PV328_010598 [Microctonus aethiopoides]